MSAMVSHRDSMGDAQTSCWESLRARRIYQNDHDAKLYLGALSCDSLTSFPEKTLESILCEQEQGPISSLPWIQSFLSSCFLICVWNSIWRHKDHRPGCDGSDFFPSSKFNHFGSCKPIGTFQAFKTWVSSKVTCMIQRYEMRKRLRMKNKDPGMESRHESVRNTIAH